MDVMSFLMALPKAYHLCCVVIKMNYQKEGTTYADCKIVIMHKNNKVNQMNFEFQNANYFI